MWKGNACECGKNRYWAYVKSSRISSLTRLTGAATGEEGYLLTVVADGDLWKLDERRVPLVGVDGSPLYLN